MARTATALVVLVIAIAGCAGSTSSAGTTSNSGSARAAAAAPAPAAGAEAAAAPAAVAATRDPGRLATIVMRSFARRTHASTTSPTAAASSCSAMTATGAIPVVDMAPALITAARVSSSLPTSSLAASGGPSSPGRGSGGHRPVDGRAEPVAANGRLAHRAARPGPAVGFRGAARAQLQSRPGSRPRRRRLGWGATAPAGTQGRH